MIFNKLIVIFFLIFSYANNAIANSQNIDVFKGMELYT